MHERADEADCEHEDQRDERHVAYEDTLAPAGRHAFAAEKTVVFVK